MDSAEPQQRFIHGSKDGFNGKERRRSTSERREMRKPHTAGSCTHCESRPTEQIDRSPILGQRPRSENGSPDEMMRYGKVENGGSNISQKEKIQNRPQLSESRN